MTFTIEQVKGKIREMYGDGISLITENYKNVEQRLNLSCKEHGEFCSSFRRLIYKKRGCPLCFKLRKLKDDLAILEDLKAQGYSVKIFKENYLTAGIITTDLIEVGCIHGTRTIPMRKVREGVYSCNKCTYTRSFEDWVKLFREVHGDKYLYEKPEDETLVGSKKLVTIYCKSHGKFKKRYIKHRGNQGCPTCARLTLKPHTKTLVERDVAHYKNRKCYLYLLSLSEDTYKIGLSINPAERVSTIRTKLRFTKYNPEILQTWETNTYDAVYIEEDTYNDLGLSPSEDLFEMFAGYTETFICKNGIMVSKVIEEFTKRINRR